MKLFTKEQLSDMLSHVWEKDLEFKAWLHNNHKDILREWEATQGNLRLHIL